MQPTFRTLPVLDLLLHRENPRHVAKENQADVIAYLLQSEEVNNLARHMSQNGINPLEVVAVFPDEDGNLIVAEGNRRICAAQLLTDPEKAPDSWRSRFRTLAKNARNVSQVNVAEFPDYNTAQPWLQVLHDGEQDGIGRRRWKPDQKARATTSTSTNALAVALLDYAEAEGMVADDARKDIRVSTVTRYLANPRVREAMGLDSPATSERIVVSTDAARFRKTLVKLLDGVVTGELHSRSTSKDWLKFASDLESDFQAVANKTKSHELSSRHTGTAKAHSQSRVRIVQPDTRQIARSRDLIEALNNLKSPKLSSLYKSLTSLRLAEHPALLIYWSVGLC